MPERLNQHLPPLNLPRQLNRAIVDTLALGIAWLGWPQVEGSMVNHHGITSRRSFEGMYGFSICPFNDWGSVVVHTEIKYLAQDDPRYSKNGWDTINICRFTESDVETIAYHIECAGGDIRSSWNGVDLATVSFELGNIQHDSLRAARKEYSKGCLHCKKSVFCECGKFPQKYANLCIPEGWKQ